MQKNNLGNIANQWFQLTLSSPSITENPRFWSQWASSINERNGEAQSWIKNPSPSQIKWTSKSLGSSLCSAFNSRVQAYSSLYCLQGSPYLKVLQQPVPQPAFFIATLGIFCLMPFILSFSIFSLHYFILAARLQAIWLWRSWLICLCTHYSSDSLITQ